MTGDIIQQLETQIRCTETTLVILKTALGGGKGPVTAFTQLKTHASKAILYILRQWTLTFLASGTGAPMRI